MVGFLKRWKAARLTFEGAQRSLPSWRLGRLMTRREDPQALDAAERRQFIGFAQIMAAHMAALQRYLATGAWAQHDDAVKCIILFAACALGSDGRPWEVDTVQRFSQGLYEMLARSPEEFVSANMHVFEALLDHVQALRSDLLALQS